VNDANGRDLNRDIASLVQQRPEQNDLSLIDTNFHGEDGATRVSIAKFLQDQPPHVVKGAGAKAQPVLFNVIPVGPQFRHLTDEALFAVAVDGDLRRAVSQAYAHLVSWLAESLDLNRRDIYQLISQAGSLEMGGMVIPLTYTVAAGIGLERLPPRCRKKLAKWRPTLAT